MFTGIIEDVGTVVTSASAAGGRMVVQTRLATGDQTDLKLGQSVAVHGPCLTVVEHVRGRLTFDVSPETMRRSTLGTFASGARVHLERALRLGDRLDGHIVQGHVDGVGTVVRLQQLGPGRGAELVVAAPDELLRYIVPKGSIAVDGVSLTVATLEGNCFGIALVPHTGAETSLTTLSPGHRVNLETDVLGRYVERLLGLAAPAAAPPGGLTLGALAAGGFLDR